MVDLVDVNLASGAENGFTLLNNIAMTQLKIALDALEKNSFAKTLSNPKVLVKNNTPAKFIQGTQFQVKTKTTNTNGDITENINYKDANLRLEIIPKISKNGDILMRVVVNNDELQADGSTINKMEVSTEFLIENNGVAVIGGLFTAKTVQTEQKVPVLADIPVLGHLFKSNVETDQRNELLIFISPQII